MSRECRETFANDSCDNRQNVSQISLEIVANCSHPSEILALIKGFIFDDDDDDEEEEEEEDIQ